MQANTKKGDKDLASHRKSKKKNIRGTHLVAILLSICVIFVAVGVAVFLLNKEEHRLALIVDGQEVSVEQYNTIVLEAKNEKVSERSAKEALITYIKYMHALEKFDMSIPRDVTAVVNKKTDKDTVTWGQISTYNTTTTKMLRSLHEDSSIITYVKLPYYASGNYSNKEDVSSIATQIIEKMKDPDGSGTTAHIAEVIYNNTQLAGIAVYGNYVLGKSGAGSSLFSSRALPKMFTGDMLNRVNNLKEKEVMDYDSDSSFTVVQKIKMLQPPNNFPGLFVETINNMKVIEYV